MKLRGRKISRIAAVLAQRVVVDFLRAGIAEAHEMASHPARALDCFRRARANP